MGVETITLTLAILTAVFAFLTVNADKLENESPKSQTNPNPLIKTNNAKKPAIYRTSLFVITILFVLATLYSGLEILQYYIDVPPGNSQQTDLTGAQSINTYAAFIFTFLIMFIPLNAFTRWIVGWLKK